LIGIDISDADAVVTGNAVDFEFNVDYATNYSAARGIKVRTSANDMTVSLLGNRVRFYSEPPYDYPPPRPLPLPHRISAGYGMVYAGAGGHTCRLFMRDNRVEVPSGVTAYDIWTNSSAGDRLIVYSSGDSASAGSVRIGTPISHNGVPWMTAWDSALGSASPLLLPNLPSSPTSVSNVALGVDASGTLKKVTALLPTSTPPTAASPCNYGQVAFDGTYAYFCYKANQWGRVTLDAW